MTVDEQQLRAIAFLCKSRRDQLDGRWDLPGIVKALEKVAHLDLTDVTLAAMRAADDPQLMTPGSIGNVSGSCWRERNTNRPAPREKQRGPFCLGCGAPKGALHPEDHVFVQRGSDLADHAPDNIRDLYLQAKPRPAVAPPVESNPATQEAPA